MSLKLMDLLIEILTDKNHFKDEEFWRAQIKPLTSELRDYNDSTIDETEVPVVINIFDKVINQGTNIMEMFMEAQKKIAVIRKVTGDDEIGGAIISPGGDTISLEELTNQMNLIQIDILASKEAKRKLQTVALQNQILKTLR